jgi:hypothetical protein
LVVKNKVLSLQPRSDRYFKRKEIWIEESESDWRYEESLEKNIQK